MREGGVGCDWLVLHLRGRGGGDEMEEEEGKVNT